MSSPSLFVLLLLAMVDYSVTPVLSVTLLVVLSLAMALCIPRPLSRLHSTLLFVLQKIMQWVHLFLPFRSSLYRWSS